MKIEEKGTGMEGVIHCFLNLMSKTYRHKIISAQDIIDEDNRNKLMDENVPIRITTTLTDGTVIELNKK